MRVTTASIQIAENKYLRVRGVSDGHICKYGWFTAQGLNPWPYLLGGKTMKVVQWILGDDDELIMVKEEELDRWQRDTYETERLMFGYKYCDPYDRGDSVKLSQKELVETIEEGKFFKGYSSKYLDAWLKGKTNFERLAEFRHQFTLYDMETHWKTAEEAADIKRDYIQKVLKAYSQFEAF